MNTPRKLDYLDGLRGLAVLLVVTFHQRLESQTHVHHAFYGFLSPTRLGFIGVHLFLVLSGFCLTNSLIRKKKSSRCISLGRFLWDRWRRIAPPYFAALPIYLVARPLFRFSGRATLGDPVVGIKTIAKHLFFIHGLSNESFEAINSAFWTLSLEFQFYLTLPVLFALSERWGYRRVVAAVAALSVGWRLIVVHLLTYQTDLMNGFFLGRWTEFALGMAAAFWFNSPDRCPSPAPFRSILKLTVASVVAMGCGWLLHERGNETIWNQLVGLGFVLFLVAVIRSDESGGRLARCVSFPPLVRVGVISYSIYLTHSLALGWTYRGSFPHNLETSSLGEAALFTLSLSAVAIVACVFFHTIEKRFLRAIDSRPKSNVPAPCLLDPVRKRDWLLLP